MLVLEKNNKEHPTGWEFVPLSQIADINPKLQNKSINPKLEVSFVPMKCVEELSGIIDLSNSRKYEEVKKGYTYFANNDIIFAKITPCMENGKIAITKNLLNGTGFGSTEFHVIRLLHEDIPREFYFWYLIQDRFRNNAQHNMKGTAGQLRVPVSFIEESIIPVPPLNEQKRIVSKIEELSSKLDSTFDLLSRTKLQLKSQKSSLLKSAFLGELTKDKRNNNSYDSVEQLMEKIKNIRYKQEMKLQKIPLPDEDEEHFHLIPDSWKWVRVGNICLKLQYGTSEKANNDSSGIPVLRMGNIIDGELNFEDLKYFSKDWGKKDEFLLKPGDVLFNRTNSAELVGKTALVENYHTSAVYASYLIRAKVASEIVLPQILSYYTNSIFGKMFIKSVVSQQVGQANVNGTKFAMMDIPLIPLKEQVELVNKIETGISLIHNISREMDARLQNLLSLKSSILKQAFEGKLVAQDPNDEPAKVLLQKIKQGRKLQIKNTRKSG